MSEPIEQNPDSEFDAEEQQQQPTRVPMPMSDGACCLMTGLVLFIIFAMVSVTGWYLFNSHFEAQAKPLAETLLEQIKAGDGAAGAAQIGERVFAQEAKPDYAARIAETQQQFGVLKSWKYKGSLLHRLQPDDKYIDLQYEATFERGKVKIWIQAVRRADVWSLSYLEFKPVTPATWPGTTPTPTATPAP